MSRGGSSSSASNRTDIQRDTELQANDQGVAVGGLEGSVVNVENISAEAIEEGFELAEIVTADALNTVESISQDSFDTAEDLGVRTLDVAENLGTSAFDLADEFNTTSANLAQGLTEDGFDLAGDIADSSFNFVDTFTEDILGGVEGVLELNQRTFQDAVGSVSATAGKAIDSATESARSESENTNIKLIQTVGILGGLFLVSRFLGRK